MKSHALPLLASLAITTLAAVVAVASFQNLRSEEQSSNGVLASLNRGTTTFIMRERTAPTRCIGTTTITVAEDPKQIFVKVEGWSAISVFNQQARINIKGDIVFNALGQLTISLFSTTMNDREIRIGSTGINPISVRLYQGPQGTPPLFEQILPGPIALTSHQEILELHGPSLIPSAFNVALQNSARESPLIFERVHDGSICSERTSQPFDLTPYVKLAKSFSENVTRLIPNL